MEIVQQVHPTVVEVQTSGASWPAIAAGAVAAAALTLLLTAFGAGLGLSTISPWADTGVSATTFKIGAGIYLCVVAVMASAVGGYLAARLRTKWVGIHSNEVYFRDTAHGLLAWALATVLSASILGAAANQIVSHALQGAGAGAAQAAGSFNPAEIYVDKLFRSDTSAAAQHAAQQPGGITQSTVGSDNVRAETLRLWRASFQQGDDLSASERTYLVRQIAARTELSPADAERRINDVIAEAKAAADKARKAAVQLSLWLAASMLLGAFAASLAAVEGGQLRDGTWNGRVLTPRPL